MRTFLLTTLAFVLSLSVRAAEEPRDFSRYQIIIDRMPFGGQVGGSSSAAAPFATRYQLVGLVSSNGPGGPLQAILMDKSAPNRSFFRGEGEMIDSVKVVKINAELPQRSVVLQQGLETATLTFSERRTVAPMPNPASGPPGMPGMVAPTDNPPGETPAVPSTAPTSPRRIPFRR